MQAQGSGLHEVFHLTSSESLANSLLMLSVGFCISCFEMGWGSLQDVGLAKSEWAG